MCFLLTDSCTSVYLCLLMAPSKPFIQHDSIHLHVSHHVLPNLRCYQISWPLRGGVGSFLVPRSQAPIKDHFMKALASLPCHAMKTLCFSPLEMWGCMFHTGSSLDKGTCQPLNLGSFTLGMCKQYLSALYKPYTMWPSVRAVCEDWTGSFRIMKDVMTSSLQLFLK